MKKLPEFTEAALGWFALTGLFALGLLGVITWNWWLLLTPLVIAGLGRWGVLRARFILTPIGSIATCVSDTHSVRTYVSYYVFGIRIANFHTNR